jgi:hypothetical protein
MRPVRVDLVLSADAAPEAPLPEVPQCRLAGEERAPPEDGGALCLYSV